MRDPMETRAACVLAAMVLLSSQGSGAADAGAADLDARLKACHYGPKSPIGEPCIDRDRRDLSIEGDRLVFRERHQHQPYAGGPACSSDSTERVDSAAVADLSPDVRRETRSEGFWLVFRCRNDEPCIKFVRESRNGFQVKKAPKETEQARILTAFSCNNAEAVALELKQLIESRQPKP